MRHFALIFVLCLQLMAAQMVSAAGSIVLVGINSGELAYEEAPLVQEKQLIEIPYTNNWQDEIIQYTPDKIILRQPSGFVGLYEPNGDLLRRIELKEAPNIPQYSENDPPDMRNSPYVNFSTIGYKTGGRVDPYLRGKRYQANRQALAPGWGYGQVKKKRGYTDAALDFLRFAPIDVVTPFNYPGTFDALSISSAYTLGVLPHVGALAVEVKQASNNKRAYKEAAINVPDYAEQPVQYFNQYEPSNPISQDLNQFQMRQYPRAFLEGNPGYLKRVEQNNQRIEFDPDPLKQPLQSEPLE